MKKNNGIFQNGLFNYMPSLLFFTSGIFLGAIFANMLSTENITQLKSYIDQFLANFKPEELESIILLKISFIQHIKTIIILWVLGLFVFGAPLIYSYLIIKGFGYGFTSAFIMKQLGWTGFMMGVFGYLPQNILLIPTIILLAIAGIQYSSQKGKKTIPKNRKFQDEHKQSFASYTLYLFTASAIVLVCSLMEAYITPTLLKLIIG